MLASEVVKIAEQGQFHQVVIASTDRSKVFWSKIGFEAGKWLDTNLKPEKDACSLFNSGFTYLAMEWPFRGD